MEDVKEFYWMLKLYNSKFLYSKIHFKLIGGCKKDFEKIVGTFENDKFFRVWLDYLISEGVLKFYEKRKVGSFGNEVDTYVVIKDKLSQLIKSNDLYPDIKKFINSEYFVVI